MKFQANWLWCKWASGPSTWLDWVNNEGCMWMTRPTWFSCCVAEVGPLQRRTKTTVVGLQGTVWEKERQGWAILKDIKPAGEHTNYDGEKRYHFHSDCALSQCLGWKLERNTIPWERLGGEKIFSMFSSWHINGLIKRCWWCFGLMGAEVLCILFKLLSLLCPKQQQQSPSEVSHHRGFVYDFAFPSAVWTSLVVAAVCGVQGTSEAKH